VDLDWALILTQIVAFAIAVVVLKKYAFGPILGMIDARRDRIKQSFDEAEAAQKRLDGLTEQYEAKLRDIDAEARERIQAAVKEGQRLATEIGENAREEAHAYMDKARAQLEREYDTAKVQMRNEMVEMAVGATEKFLRKTIDAAEHRELIARYLDDLGSLEH
jgi:F-type H+-transporting ATPase subunit b